MAKKTTGALDTEKIKGTINEPVKAEEVMPAEKPAVKTATVTIQWRGRVCIHSMWHTGIETVKADDPLLHFGAGEYAIISRQ